MGLLLFKGLCVLGQPLEIKGIVLNSQTLEPIPFANVAIAGSLKGTYSNQNGEFKLTVSQEDSLEFSSVGFSNLTLITTQIGDSILLHPQATVLNEIVVSPHPKPKKNQLKQTFGYFREKNTGLFIGHKQVAVKFNNQPRNEGFIEKVFLRIGHNLKKDYGKHLVLIKFLHISKSNLPGELLFALDEPIVVYSKQQRVVVELKDYHIPFPKEGCFLAVEFLGYYADNTIFTPYNNVERLSYPYAPSFSRGHHKGNSFIGNGSYWKPVDLSTNNAGFMNFNFSVDINFYAD